MWCALSPLPPLPRRRQSKSRRRVERTVDADNGNRTLGETLLQTRLRHPLAGNKQSGAIRAVQAPFSKSIELDSLWSFQ